MSAMIMGGCEGGDEERGSQLSSAAFDTVAVIGALEGEEWEVFGIIGGVATSEQGNIAVLDLQGRTVSVFGPDGDFVASITERGEGPGELGQPWGVAWIGDDRLLVTDRGNARISEFLLQGASLEYERSMAMPFPLGDICTVGDRIFGAGYRQSGSIHAFGWDDEDTEAFASVPELAALSRLDGLSRELALRQWTVGRLLCDGRDNRVLEVGVLNIGARLFAGDGTTLWQQQWEDLHMMEPVEEDGAFFGRPDEVTGAHVAQSVLMWDSDRVLVQYARRFPDGANGDERPVLDSRLILLETGNEEERSTSLPALVGRSADRFLHVRNEPYPQLLILGRVL